MRKERLTVVGITKTYKYMIFFLNECNILMSRICLYKTNNPNEAGTSLQPRLPGSVKEDSEL